MTSSTIYTSSSHTLYAFDAFTGSEKWSYQTGNFIFASPTVMNGTVYIGSEDNKLYAFDAVSGHEKWFYQTGGSISSTPTVVNKSVYIGSADGNVYAIQPPG